MANSEFTVRVKVQGGADVDAIKKALAGLGATVTDTNRRTAAAGKAQDDFFDTQKKGIIGTANSTKSFSKLAETLGGNSSGIVAAYATLAANVFAVTAAFNALRGAAQVEQILRGLDAAGTRTGLSLTTTANALREVTGNAIDTEQALRSTAQIVSAGFDSKTVERLGAAAKDASFALGRNMTDSLDRLSRGIVKLEPELLDELGLMTKLTESNVNYARQLGKSESQLTSFEKRQGFANAVLAEAELKFGGLSKAAGDATAYDQLASSFKNLTNSIFNYGNIVGKPLAKVLTADTYTLLGVMVLFGSTLKNQLLPGLANTAVRATAAAKAQRDLATQALEAVKTSKAQALQQQATNLASKQNFDYIGNVGPAKYMQYRDAVKAGTASLQEQNAALNSLRASLRLQESQLANHSSFSAADPANATRRADKEARIAGIREEIRAQEELATARANGNRLDAEGTRVVNQARRDSISATYLARSQEQKAAAIGAASQLKLGESWKQLALSVNSYARSQAIATTEGITNMARLRIAVFATSGAFKVLGTSILAALPYIGLVVLAIGLVKSGLEALKSDAVKRLEKSMAELAEVTAKANDYNKELVRISESQATASQRAAAAITIQSNAVREATEKYADFAEAFRNANTSDMSDLLGTDTENKVASWWQTLGARGALSFSYGLKKNSESLKLAQALQGTVLGVSKGNLDEGSAAAVSYFNSLEQANKKGLDAVVKTRGGYAKLAQTLKSMNSLQAADYMEKLGKEVNALTSGGEDSVKTFQEAFKNLGNTLADFNRTNIPTTPYDNLVKGFEAAQQSMNELKKTINPQEISALLSGLDANTVRTLNLDTQQDIVEYNKAAEIVQQLKARRKELEGQGQKLNFTDTKQLEAAEKTLATNRNLGGVIARQIDQRTSLVLQAQEQERLQKSQLALLNAQMQTNSRIYQTGAAGLKARLDGEERSRQLQIASLRTQIDITRTLTGNLEARLEELKINKVALELEKQRLISAKDYRREWAETMRGQALFNLNQMGISQQEAAQRTARGPVSVDQLPGEGRTRALLLNSWKKADDIANSTLDTRSLTQAKEKEIAAVDGQIASAQREMRDSVQQIAALQNQIKTIQEAALDPQQKAAELANAQRQYYSQLVNSLNEQAKGLGTLEGIYSDIDARVAGVSDRLDYQLSQIRRRATLERQELDRTKAAGLGQLQSNLQLAQADLARERRQGVKVDIEAAEAGVKFAENALEVSRNDYDLSLQQINATERQATLEKALFDSRSQGIEWQRQSLDYSSKILDLQKDLNDAELSGLTTRNKLMAKRQGFEVSAASENALEIEAAKRAYDFAVAESSMRKSMIDLEYALLEAQRDQLTLELRARQSVLDQADVRYKQIDNVVGRIESIDFNAAAETAKKTIDLNIENKFSELELARTSSYTDGPFAKGLAAVVGAIQQNNARRASTTAPPAPAAQSVVIDRSKPIPLDQVPQSPEIAANRALIGSIDKLRNTLETWLRDNPLRQAEFSETSYGAGDFKGAVGNVKTAMEFFLQKGLTAAQAAGVVGNLQQESTAKIDPRADNGTHKGIAQWDTTRQAKFFKMFGETLESSSLNKQLEYLWHEMKNDPYENRKLREAGFFDRNNTARESAKAFEGGFERSGGSALDKRMRNAENLVESVSTTMPRTVAQGGQALVDSAKSAGTAFADSVQATRPKVVSAKEPSAASRRETQYEAPTMAGKVEYRGELVEEPKPLPLKSAVEYLNTPPDPFNAKINLDAGSLSDSVSASVKTGLDSATTAKPGIDQVRDSLGALNTMTEATRESLKDLSPEGVLVASVMEGTTSIANGALNALQVFSESSETIAQKMKDGMSQSQAEAQDFASKFTSIASVASSALSTVQSAVAASAQAKEDAIQREIEAEQKRDGKSAESLAKIASLEKRKDAIAKKQFNTNKKLQMAQAVIATAAGVAQALSMGPIIGPIMAGVIAAMGAAQIAIISGTQYQSSASTAAASLETPTLSIGKRGDTVDLAKQNSNVGGELGYLRGKQGVGSNASNYSVIGSATGGELPRGYGNTAYVVGEKGPETLYPDTPITVRPANDNAGSAPVNATINIHALDARGVEDVLHSQKGNLISMFREAANANGQPFMEDVNVNSYSRPNATANSRL